MSSEEVKAAIDNLESSKEEFATHLETARALWRKYPALVEAPEFPAQFIESFRKLEHREPGVDIEYWDRELVCTGILPYPAEYPRN